jgi:glycerol-3-phosphate dehydrogenase
MVMTVADVMIRRTHLYHTHPGQATEAATAVAGLLGRELGWNEAAAEGQAQAYRDEAARMRRAITPR